MNSNIQNVLVFKRTEDQVPMMSGRDEFLEQVYNLQAHTIAVEPGLFWEHVLSREPP